MSKCTEIRDFMGDYAFDVKYSENNQFTMFFNSRRNAETVKRCIEADDSVPNAATAVDFVEVVRCKDCLYSFMSISGERVLYCDMHPSDEHLDLDKNYFCAYGERK